MNAVDVARARQEIANLREIAALLDGHWSAELKRTHTATVNALEELINVASWRETLDTGAYLRMRVDGWSEPVNCTLILNDGTLVTDRDAFVSPSLVLESEVIDPA